MAGRSRFVAVCYHESNPLPDGTQQLGYTLYDAVAFQVISKGSVSCISKGSSLSWVGFSNDCSLMVMDTDGMLSMLIPTGNSEIASGIYSWEWVPVLDTIGMRKSADDQFWPVTVYDGKLVCVPLKGGNTFPDASRRPVTTTLGLRLCLARSSVSKKYVRLLMSLAKIKRLLTSFYFLSQHCLGRIIGAIKYGTLSKEILS